MQRTSAIVRGKERGESFLIVADDGEGVPKDAEGAPDFKYVATHLCDSVKRRLKAQGATGIQGEFGIGLMSFWTLGEALTMTCAGTDGCTYQMHLARNDPSYTVTTRRSLAPTTGTVLKVKPLLSGIRQLSGERLSWHLASELRDRVSSGFDDIRIERYQLQRVPYARNSGKDILGHWASRDVPHSDGIGIRGEEMGCWSHSCRNDSDEWIDLYCLGATNVVLCRER